MKKSKTESEKTTGSRYKVKNSKKAPISITKTNDTVNYTQGGGAYTQGGGASMGGGTQGFVPKGNMRLKDNSIQSSKNTTIDTTV